ncbi:MAG: aminopeptidase P family protein [Thermoanaerobaculia bacterium]|nr:aminopeptidase P family protein [Thermoanaerobaculia bacterium]
MSSRAVVPTYLHFSPLGRLMIQTGALALMVLATVAASAPTSAQQPADWDQGVVLHGPGAVLAERDRIDPMNRSLTERLETVLPRLMKETGLDMWLVLNREYAEDPVYFSLVPQPTFAARRTTMLVFFDGPNGFERLTVNRYPLGEPYEAAWQGRDLEAQWQALGELISEKNPQKIGINVSRHWPVADGLTHGLHQRLTEVLSDELRERLTSAEELVVRWIETRTETELEVFPHVVQLARGVIAEAFSSRVITPGVTTTEDVAWYIRERFTELGLPIWFQPYVNAQRPGLECVEETPFCGSSGVIRPGDVLHTDVGICYLRLCTDTQEMGYVLRLGEENVPAGLEEALTIGNHWQDLLTSSFENGRTGNEILAAARMAADSEGILSSVYTHPLGFFGHAPGPTIGMWDNQGETPVRGDWPLFPMTAYAIEGNVKVPLAEWDGQLVQIKLEQSAVWNGSAVLYLAGRQTDWHVVR